MGCIYKEIKLQNKNRGAHLITIETINNIEEKKNRLWNGKYFYKAYVSVNKNK